MKNVEHQSRVNETPFSDLSVRASELFSPRHGTESTESVRR